MTMSTTPKLELPQRAAPARARGGGAGVMVLLLLVAGLQVWSLVRGGGTEEGAGVAAGPERATDREVALKLEDRNLPEAAVAAWERYLASASPAAADEGAIRYRMGKLLQQAHRYEEAAGTFYLAEALLGEGAGDLKRQITVRVRECLQKLGQYSDLSREMAARADVSGEGDSLQSRQVVAQIGEEKITVSDFDRMLTEQIDQAIALQVGIGEAEADRIRRQAHSRFADPKAKAEQLQQLVASRVLADEARQRGLEHSDSFRRQLAEFADRMLATSLLREEVGKRGTVTPADVDRFYEANKDRYTDPAEARIAHILVATEGEAREVLDAARSGTDFAELARAHSLDAGTKDDGGVIAQPVVEGGEGVPGIGRQASLHAAILSAPEGTLLAEPFESDAGWHLVKVIERRERREHSLEDVRDRVERDVAAARRSEVTDQYLRELFEARGVKFYPKAFVSGEDGAAPEAG